MPVRDKIPPRISSLRSLDIGRVNQEGREIWPCLRLLTAVSLRRESLRGLDWRRGGVVFDGGPDLLFVRGKMPAFGLRAIEDEGFEIFPSGGFFKEMTFWGRLEAGIFDLSK